MSTHSMRRHSPDGEPAGPASGPAGGKNGGRRGVNDRPPPPRSDVGTIVLHWSLAAAIIVSLFTGLRLSADAEGSIFAKSIEVILPQGEIWTEHFISALVVLAGIITYGLYMRLGRLKRRISVRKTVVLTLPASPKLRWGAINVIFYWALFAAVLTLAVTGVLLFLGHGGLVVTIHYVSALVVAAYIVIHVFNHYMYGGVQQLLRLFRPQALRVSPGTARRPLAVSLAAGVVAAAVAIYADFGFRDVLTVPRTDQTPVLDGDLADPVWGLATPVFVRTQQGVNLAGESGASTVEIRAVHDTRNIYFAFRWDDPSRSLKRHPLIKRENGWHIFNNKADSADETAYYEDKFAVMFSKSDAFGTGGVTHMGPRPLAEKPGALNKRGLHYTTDGSLADVWQWKAARGGMLGAIDDMWFGAPVEPTEAQIAGKSRYSAGYAPDDGKSLYVYNYGPGADGGLNGPVAVKRLPVDYAATTARLGHVDLTAGASDEAGSQWWMFERESVPYSAERDAAIPVGTVLPSVLIMGEFTGSRADVTGGARWQDGHWTLEMTRKLKTGQAQDLDMETGLYLWVSVFDHNQTRHTRHVRPVRLEIE